MRSPHITRRTRTRAKAALAASAMALAVLSAPAAAHADAPAPPTFADGFGLTQVGSPVGTATDFTLTVTTTQVAGPHHIQIFLPADYATAPTKRYPVLYLLHGSPDDPANLAGVQPYLSGKMITVIPDGGLRGWYENWLQQNTVMGAQNWQTFHIDQVIPFIDANLRTIADRQHRAIAGVSMGGFGAFHYAEADPALFSQVASFSGGIDMSEDDLAVRLAVVGEETNIGAGLTSGAIAGFGPPVSSDAIFGTPYWPFDGYWSSQDPSSTANLSALTGMGVAVYTGNGRDGAGTITNLEESLVESAAQHTEDRLNADGIPSYYVDYGDGSTWGTTCDGGHDYGCWVHDFADYSARLEAAFGLS